MTTNNTIELYDSTLRDGVQAVGANLDHKRRVELFRALDEFGVNFVELGWPTKDKEKEFLRVFKECRDLQRRSNITAFGSTSLSSNPNDDPNYETMVKTGTEYVCLFGKSWMPHIREQLRITPEENLKRIRDSIDFFKQRGVNVFYDAEHYFDGYKDDNNYALETLVGASNAGAQRIILCDTNGASSHRQLFMRGLGVKEIVENTRRGLDDRGVNTSLGVHLHNDRGQALDATMESLPYVVQVQGTMHGKGERVGNLDLASFIARYFLEVGEIPGIDLTQLRKISDLSFILSGLPLPDPDNRPFVGDVAFAHKGGVHIDAMVKKASYEHTDPILFGNKRNYVLNTLGGRSGIIENAKSFGYNLDKRNPEVIRRAEDLYRELQELEHKGYRLGTIEAEKFLLIEKYFGNLRSFFDVSDWSVSTGQSNEKMFSNASLVLRVHGGDVRESVNLEGLHGPVDALYKVFVNSLSSFYPSLRDLQLVGFDSKIAHQHGEESSMRTLVAFRNSEHFETVGVDNNIIGSAIEALTKGFTYHLQRNHS